MNRTTADTITVSMLEKEYTKEKFKSYSAEELMDCIEMLEHKASALYELNRLRGCIFNAYTILEAKLNNL